MQTVIDFLLFWADLIIAVFTKYPLAGALLTAAAVGGFFYLQKHPIRQVGVNPIANAFVVLIAWLITVPLLGTVFDLINRVSGGFFFLYDHFEDQPVYVIALMVIAVAAHFVWGWIAKNAAPSAWIRVTLIVIAFVIVTAVTVPVINQFTPSQTSEQESQKAN